MIRMNLQLFGGRGGGSKMSGGGNVVKQPDDQLYGANSAEPSYVAYASAISQTNNSYTSYTSSVQANGIPSILKNLKEGDILEISQKGSTKPERFEITSEGVKYSSSSSFESTNLTMDKALKKANYDVKKVVTIKRKK